MKDSIKKALKSKDLGTYIKCFEDVMDEETYSILAYNKNLNMDKFSKFIAFQIGQAIGLMYGKRIFTKQTLVNNK